MEKVAYELTVAEARLTVRGRRSPDRDSVR